MKCKIILCLASLLAATMVKSQVTTTSKSASNVVVNKAIVSPITTQNVKIEDLEESLCPKKLMRGDREFGGHGPKVKCEVKLRIGRDSVSLWADYYLWAQETVHDFSTTEGNWSRKVYDAPYGQKILRIKSATASRTQFISPAAGFQFIVPGEDVKGAMKTFFDGSVIANAVMSAHGFPSGVTATKGQVAQLISQYSKGNTVVKVPATDGTLVKFFHIVGDTGGDDISTDDNCNDDTRIVKIEFFPVTLEMRKQTN